MSVSRDELLQLQGRLTRSLNPVGDTAIKAVMLLQGISAKGFLHPCADNGGAPTACTSAVKQACQCSAQKQPKSAQVHWLGRVG